MSPRLSVSGVRRVLLALLAVAGMAAVALLTVLADREPSNDRTWAPDQRALPVASFAGDSVVIANVRNNVYRSVSDYDVRLEERRYDLRGLESVWFIVEPFGDVKGPAHTFVSFGFDDGQYVAVSVEIRKEDGESFSPLQGVLRRYELMYVVGDERDLIGLRANHRRDEVFLYRAATTPEKGRRLFTSMLRRANQLAEQPEFYNTLTSTCTTNIVRHVNEITPKRVPFSHRTLLNAYADELEYEIGMLDTTVAFETLRARARINDRARRYADSPAFSRMIRAPASE